MTARKTSSAKPTLKQGLIPWLKKQSVFARSVLALIGTALAVITSAAVIDARYARAGDLAIVHKSIKQNTLQSEIGLLELRKNQLDDRVFDMETRGVHKMTPAERQILLRYKQEQDSAARDIRSKKRILDELKADK